MFYCSFLEKRTKSMGRCDSPHTPNAAQVWNAATATNHGNFPSLTNSSLAKKFFRDFRKYSATCQLH